MDPAFSASRILSWSFRVSTVYPNGRSLQEKTQPKKNMRDLIHIRNIFDIKNRCVAFCKIISLQKKNTAPKKMAGIFPPTLPHPPKAPHAVPGFRHGTPLYLSLQPLLC